MMTLAAQSFLEHLQAMPQEFPTLTLVFAAILGLLVGSFSNVLIYRLPRYCMSIAKPASHCPKCDTPIAWFDNIPVFSWLILLRAKCRHCKVRIPMRYPAVELAIGALFFFLAKEVLLRDWQTPSVATTGEHYILYFFWANACVMLFVGAWIDAQMQIIPDRISLGGAALGLLCAPFVGILHQWAVPERLVSDALFHLPFSNADLPAWVDPTYTTFLLMIIAATALWCFGLLGYLIAPREAKAAGGGMGMGDVKLIMFMAAILGWPKLLLAFMIAIMLGAVIGFPKLLKKWSSGGEATSVMAFGPFLCAGAIGAILFARPLFSIVVAYCEMVGLIPKAP